MSSSLDVSLEDEKVLLRQWAPTDVEFYVDHLGNEATAQYLGGILERQQAWRHLASVIGHWSLRGFGPYAVVDSRSQQLQGCAGVWEPDGWPCREFVFWFTAAAYDSSHALSAARLVLEAMRSSFNDEVITGFIHPSNGAALRLAGELGATLHEEARLFNYGPHIRVSYAGSRRPTQTQPVP
jgi:RimJ/RimL family protein N-acetyltransferase